MKEGENFKMFITFEGGEGSGKSTAIKKLEQALINAGKKVLITREPGGTPISEQIREVILRKENTSMDPWTEAYLYAASRRQHVIEKIKPALEKGIIVISDRYLDSSLAYQGGARGLGIKEVLTLNHFAIDGLFPDLTIFFDLPPEEGLSRISHNSNREVNRLDVERMAFHEKVRAAFYELKTLYPERIHMIDASLTPDEVFAEIEKLIPDLLRK